MKTVESMVAIFIPTHNRKDLLLKNLQWLQSSEFIIYVADSSEYSLDSEINLLNFNKGYSQINYYHSANQNYFEKIANALRNIKMPYVVMCPDDDYILWQNIKYFYECAISSGATTVCGRDLVYSLRNENHFISESSRYRKFCIRSHDSKLNHLIAGMNPIVCTYYQFYKTNNLRDIWSHLLHQRSYMPGNKFVEILFRSSCFIDGPVYFCDKILRIIGEAIPLRSYDKSSAVTEYSMNFWDEFKAMKKSGLLTPYILNHSKYLSLHFNVSIKEAKSIVINNVLNPMFSRMNTKHEILWDQCYSIVLSALAKGDNTTRNKADLEICYSLRDRSHRIPSLVSNLDDFLFHSEEEWQNMLEFIDWQINISNTPVFIEPCFSSS